MPTFLPINPVTIAQSSGFGIRDSGFESRVPSPESRLLAVFLAEGLDLHVDTSRQIELHQRVDRLRGRLEDVDQPLVRADLELLARLLVDVRRTEHRPLVLRGRQRNRPGQARAGPLRRVDDLARRLIEHAVVVRLQADANLFTERCCSHVYSYFPCMRATTSSLTFCGACS